MKRNMNVTLVIIMLMLFAIVINYINKNTEKYIMQDGMLLALTLDGNSITSFPERGAYNINVDCGDTADGVWLAEEWRLAVDNIVGNVDCIVSFASSPKTLRTEVEGKANTNSNGYRYSGKYPDNWVWFNGEKWRIIGSIPTCTSSGCATSENLVKIIRNGSIGTYAYDTSDMEGTNLKGAWGSNTLYSLLNTGYYSTDATAMNGQNHAGCYGYYTSSSQPKPNCDYSEIGILASSYYGRMVKNVYWNTGAVRNSKTPIETYTDEIVTQTVSGYVGLMTKSDWGYAADSSYHNLIINADNKFTETTWLFNGCEWTSSASAHETFYVNYVNSHGTINDYFPWFGWAVRPVVYLDPSVYVISGDGTEGNPYQIGM